MLGYALVMLFFFFTAPLLLFNVFVLLPPKLFPFCILRINPSKFLLALLHGYSMVLHTGQRERGDRSCRASGLFSITS